MVRYNLIKKCIFFILIFLYYTPSFALPNQTDINNAEHLIDEAGIPRLRVKGMSEDIYNPAFIAIYALHYAGSTDYESEPYVQKDLQKFSHCAEWLNDHLKKNDQNFDVWFYNFDSTYNHTTIKAPWFSCFAQAAGIEVLLTSFQLTNNKIHLESAEKAAEAFFHPISLGGLQFTQNDDIWFEEIPTPTENPTHILNGHMRSLIALKKLYNVTQNNKYNDLYQKGILTLERWLPLFDASYWLKYDLAPKYEKILFRLNTTTGEKLQNIPIHKIGIQDISNNKSNIISLGKKGDDNGSNCITGESWEKKQKFKKKHCRKLKKTVFEPKYLKNDLKFNHSPFSYFYLTLPSIPNNLRTEPYTIFIDYFDSKKGSLDLEIRSMAPGKVFKKINNSHLHLTGTNQWKRWNTEITLKDLGYWVGDFYADKHLRYLSILAKNEPKLNYWVQKAQKYLNNLKESYFKNPEHLLDNDGLPSVKIHAIDKIVQDPKYVALYALSYAGHPIDAQTDYAKKDSKKLIHCAKWLMKNLTNNAVWEDVLEKHKNKNNVFVDTCTQLLGIQALLEAYSSSNKNKYLNIAKKIVDTILKPISENGFLYIKDTDVWFIQSTNEKDNISFDLYTQILGIYILKKISQISPSEHYHKYYNNCLSSLKKHLIGFDTGYWFKSKLCCDTHNLKIKFANPYDFQLPQIPIEKIKLTNPNNNKTVVFQAKEFSQNDNNSWNALENLDGKSCRFLNNNKENIFTLNLQNDEFNLNKKPYVLTIYYKDTQTGNLNIQLHTMSPNKKFQDLNNSDILLTGSAQWRKWKIPINHSAISDKVSPNKLRKIKSALEEIEKDDPFFIYWKEKIQTYLNASSEKIKINRVKPVNYQIPKQTEILPVHSLDKNGVIRMHVINLKDPTNKIGISCYSPFAIAQQACGIIPNNIDQENSEFVFDPLDSLLPNQKKLHILPAFQWIFDNTKDVESSKIWHFNFNNTYNDIISSSPWQSSFSQAYIIKALMHGIEQNINPQLNLKLLLEKALLAYRILVENGGILSKTLDDIVFFEEVPEKSHILNAHLASIGTIKDASSFLNKEEVWISEQQNAIESLYRVFHLYDNGYWLRYDANPKKSLQFRIDPIIGEQSPAIHEIELTNMQTLNSVVIKMGDQTSLLSWFYKKNRKVEFKPPACIQGSFWGPLHVYDTKKTRMFTFKTNKKKNKPVDNAGFMLVLPDNNFGDFFHVPLHRLTIRYKDTHQGKFLIKLHSICSIDPTMNYQPIRHPLWTCEGDQQWKEVSFDILPQDLGWFVGPFYQKYHAEQLHEIGIKFNHWFFKQQSEKHKYYHDLTILNQSPIVVQ